MASAVGLSISYSSPYSLLPCPSPSTPFFFFIILYSISPLLKDLLLPLGYSSLIVLLLVTSPP